MINKIAAVITQIIFIYFLGCSAISFGAQVTAGDNAPRGARDGVLNVADMLLLERFVLGLETPTAEEFKVANVAPLGAPDNVLNVADLLVLQRAVLGLITLPSVNLVPDAPVLNANTCSANANPCAISGTSTAGSTVHIYVNGVEQTPATVNTSGVFATSIALLDGDNSVYAITQVSNDYSAASKTLTVNYVNNISRTQSALLSSAAPWIVWTAGNSPTYTISGAFAIPAGVKLTLQPGVILKVANGKTFTINAGVDLEINAGAQVQFAATTIITGIEVFGTLNAKGTAASPVIFNNTTSGINWNGIIVRTGGNVQITHALIDGATTGVEFRFGSSPATNPSHITYSTFKNNITAAISTSGENNGAVTNPLLINNPMPVVNYCNIDDSNGSKFSAISYVDAQSALIDARYNWWGTLNPTLLNNKISSRHSTNSQTNTRPNIDISPILDAENGNAYANVLMDEVTTELSGLYLVGAKSSASAINYTVQSGKVLTLTESARLVFDNNAYLIVAADGTLTAKLGSRFEFGSTAGINVYGSLLVEGSEGSPVVFTLAEYVTGSWNGIEVFADGNLLMKYAVVEKAANGIKADNATGLIEHSLVRKNNNSVTNTGIYLTGSSFPNILNNVITENKIGIKLCLSSAIVPILVNGNDIYDNSLYQVTISSCGAVPASAVAALDFSSNWWGTSTPPNIVISGITVNVSNPLTVAAKPVDLVVQTFSVSPTSISPNGDAYQDAATFTATLSANSQWDLSIKKSSQVVRQFTGTGNAVNQPWNGYDSSGALLADGCYVAELKATEAVSAKVVGASTRICINTTGPVAIILSPANNATVFNTVAISFIATDPTDFKDYQLELGNYVLQNGIQVFQSNRPKPLTTSTTSTTATGTDFTWITNSWQDEVLEANGTQVLRLTASDTNGNVSIAERTITLANPQITAVSVDKHVIKPVTGEQAVIAFTTNQPADIVVTMLPGNYLNGGTYPNKAHYTGVVPARTMNLGNLAAGAHTVAWDGRDNAGNPVDEEVYVYEIVASDTAGGFDKYFYHPATFVPITHQAITKENLTQFNPYKNQFLAFSVDMSLANAEMLPVDVGIEGGISGSGTPIVSADFMMPVLPGPVTIYVDGHDAQGKIIPEGSTYNLIVRGGDEVGPSLWSHNGMFYPVPKNYIMVQGTRAHVPQPSIKTDPYQINLSYGQVTELDYNLDIDADVTVKILAPDLQHEWVLLNNVRQTAGDHTINWDLIPAEMGAEPGHYTFQVTANHPQTGLGVTRRGNITVYR